MLSLLPGFVFGLFPPGNTQLALWGRKNEKKRKESNPLQRGEDGAESQNKFRILLQWLRSIVHMHLQALLVNKDS